MAAKCFKTNCLIFVFTFNQSFQVADDGADTTENISKRLFLIQGDLSVPNLLSYYRYQIFSTNLLKTT